MKNKQTKRIFGWWLLIAVIYLLVPDTFILLAGHTKQLTGQLIGIMGMLITYLGLIWGGWRLYRRINHLNKIKLTIFQRLQWVIGMYFGLILIVGGLTLLNQLIYHQSQTANNQVIIDLVKQGPLMKWLFGVSTIIFAPIIEELIFRGLMLNLWPHPQATWTPMVVSSILFSLGHVSSNPISFLIYFAMGMCFAYLYRQTGDLKNSMLIHIINNTLAMSSILLMY